MSSIIGALLVNNIKLPVDASENEAFSIAVKRIRRAGISFSSPTCSIFRRSIDARRKGDISFVYSIAVRADFVTTKEKISAVENISLLEDAEPNIEIGNEPLDSPPVIVGAGPAGLFAALILAESGYKPIVIERGGSVKERQRKVDEFNSHQRLDTETNIQFGAGGAGTFSDGKLITRINDPLSSYVMNRFVQCGAPPEITYLAKPHIGTDVLATVVDNMIAQIESLGGRVLYHTKLTDLEFSSNRVTHAITTEGKIATGAIVLATGHSARDTYFTLLKRGFIIEPKPFSVGMRIEHKRTDIDKALFGDMAGHPLLGHAEYALSCDTKTRGVYTFCMCPGGEVVAAASEDGGVVVNGMSRFARNSENSNSAVVVSVFREDYGNTPESAIEFQRQIERTAYAVGGNNYSAPIVTVGDFLEDKAKKDPSRVTPSYMGGKHVRVASPDLYLPKFVTTGLKRGISEFDKKIEGFGASDAVLTGAETRTSAPVRIMRESETRLALGYANVYPAGEGAGYAGGITSAAIDGIKCAIAIMKRYKPL